MNISSVITVININEDSRIPKYMQIVESIIRSIATEELKIGEKIPSINEVCYEFNLSRDTVEKAYNLLKKRKIITSVHGKGYYTTRTNLLSKINILFMINKPSSYKMEIYKAFVNQIGADGHVNLAVYHCDEYLFVNAIEKSIDMYDHYIIMPHFKDKRLTHINYTAEVLGAIEKIPKHKLILLDNKETDITGNHISIHQDFENDIYSALTKAGEKLLKYEKLVLVYPQKSVYPYPIQILYGFQKFCEKHSFDFEIIDEVYDDMKLYAREAFITIEDGDLVNLLKLVREQNMALGEDLGIISYNDTPLKELLEITVISTDFKAMGETAAKMILNSKRENVKNIFHFLDRNSI